MEVGIYTVRELLGSTYAGGQDDVLREVDLVFFTLLVGMGLLMLVVSLRR